VLTRTETLKDKRHPDLKFGVPLGVISGFSLSGNAILAMESAVVVLPMQLSSLMRRETCITRTAYYDRIATRWHHVTGYHGGAFKRYVLNNRILSQIPGIAEKAIIELGAGNGYFAPLLLRRFSGQSPNRLVITDQSQALLDIAQSSFWIDGAEYHALDVHDPFPFPDGSFNLVLASMIFNELTTAALHNALQECHRILTDDGCLIATMPHPDLVRALAKKGALTDFGHGLSAMPGAEGLRLPVSRRSADAYRQMMESSGFTVLVEDVYPDEKTLHEKPGLKVAQGTPLGLLCNCRRT
jgi:SAM-dependent methyltransferase